MRPGGSATGSVDTSLAGFAGSVDTPLAGFAGGLRRRGSRIAIPAAWRYALAVSRRMPVACSMRRSGHPSRPRARICCFLSSPKMLAILAGDHRSRRRVNVLGALLPHWPVFRYPRLAGFQVSTEDGAVEYAWRSFLGPDISPGRSF